MSAPVLLVFGLLAPDDAGPRLEQSLARLEQDAVQALAAQGFDVRPAPEGSPRPSARDATPRGGDVAARYRVHRVVSLDLSPERDRIWVVHHLRAVPGAWDVREIGCEEGDGALTCEGFVKGVLAGLRPRTHLDVNLAAALRQRARAVTRCVRLERRRGAERIFGVVEVNLTVSGTVGRARVDRMTPSRVFRSELGACLRSAFESIDVGRFRGPPLSIRVPIDL